MFVEQINLKKFRNINNLNLKFDKPITILYGENGQGKTNIVESIYLLSTTNSFRTNSYKEMINKDEDYSIVEGTAKDLTKKTSAKINLQKAGKMVFINDIALTKISDFIGKIDVICFSPEDVSLFKDSPSIRRHFLDKELSLLFPVYVKQMIAFKGVLEQRNMVLKGTIDNDLIAVLDDKLVETSYDIYHRRKWLLDKVSKFATDIYKKLTNENQKIRIEYNTFLNEDDKEKYYNQAKVIYKRCLNKDKEKSFTTIGVHKDDFKVYLNDLEIDMYASQGQQRLISLAMKLAVLEISSKANKRQPILILDDAFSELDAYKKEKLFNYVLTKEQVFITCTDYKTILGANKTSNVTLLHIDGGNVLERRTI